MYLSWLHRPFVFEDQIELRRAEFALDLGSVFGASGFRLRFQQNTQTAQLRAPSRSL